MRTSPVMTLHHRAPWSLAAALALSWAFPAVSAADVVVLNDGRTVAGDVTDKGDSVEVRSPAGVQAVPKSEIKRILKSPTELTSEADLCRKLAAGVYDEALKIDDPTQRNKKLGSAAELLQKALALYKDARGFFPGPEHEGLDRTAAAIGQELQRCKEKKAPEPSSAPPPEKPPAPKPEPVPAPAPPATPPKDPPTVAPEAKPAPKVEVKAAPPPLDLTTPSGRLLAEIRKALEGQKNTEAFSISNRILRDYPSSPEAGEAQRLVDTLPHPDGRLVCGFDAADDLKKWRLYRLDKSRLTFSISSDAREVKEGRGSCHLSFPKDAPDAPGALILELGPFDGSKFKGLSCWLYQYLPSSGELEFAFIRPNTKELTWIRRFDRPSDLGGCLARNVPLKFTGWKHVTIPAAEFQARGGSVSWADVGALAIYDRTREGAGLIADSLRLLEE